MNYQHFKASHVHDTFFIDRLGTLDIWEKCIALSFQEKTPKSLNTLEFSYLFVPSINSGNIKVKVVTIAFNYA